ncbi:hypothetical protein [Sinanaerobacter chloroacetimidivorans]|uniref:Uncharacterized protein n=1 Tax=Sinanaerobacter chloroacetimidivorans TaxID=2818044 RepID=A0A8J7W420_9FIRM|nr:hypothetical protein [Sinanaerobacter chloroacetimidivorans]MBR0598565.1 hypothetical protein [Sinanaerobacter chloroacetimidivorans]
MSNENEKKGIFGRLGGNKKSKSSCCCNVEIEEIPEEKDGDKNDSSMPDEKNSCC